jgi:phosphopantothenoylcysteine synthetase/decarboxylase
MINGSLSDRRILVTAGPTWVRIDAVRHIGNLSSGRTGLVIARALSDAGAHVLLLFGPGRTLLTAEDRRRMHVEEFITFDELHVAVRRHVGSGGFDAMIHAAAVSDYRPVSEEVGKLPSGERELVLRLRPTPKIVDEVRGLDSGILLIKFKLEVGRSPEELMRIAAESRERSDADLVVANDLSAMDPRRHPAYILDRSGLVNTVGTTDELAQALVNELSRRLQCGPA